MKTKHLLRFCGLCLAVLSSLWIGCQKEHTGPDPVAGQELDFRAGAPCMAVSLSVSGAPLGGVCLPAPVSVCGLGALPGPATIAGISGELSSVVTSQEVGSDGVLHFTLIHYFDDGAGNTFWTDDVATCAPLDPNGERCRVIDQLTVAGGTGAFANASGRLLNDGVLDFVNLTLDGRMNGRLCGVK